MTMVQLKFPENPDCPFPDYQDVSVLLPRDFTLENGERLSRPEIRIRIFGERSKPLVVALGGISSGRKIADASDGRGWWREIVGFDQSVDLNRHCVVGFDFLPNPGEEAQTLTTLDQARALAHALRILGFEKISSFIGASYGGMVALAFAAEHPDLVDHLCVISAADRAHPAATALRGIQRRILKFAADCGKPEVGIALARQLAMTTYRTPAEFAARFGGAPAAAAGEPYDVCAYLISRGAAFDIDHQRYLTLSDSIDRHCVDPSAVICGVTLISILNDQLIPPAVVRRLAASISGKTELCEIDSLFGHDAFLKEAETVGALVKKTLQEKKS